MGFTRLCLHVHDVCDHRQIMPVPQFRVVVSYIVRHDCINKTCTVRTALSLCGV